MKNTEIAEFKVEDHYFLRGRGGFVLGKILSGTFKIGMAVFVDKNKKALTISGIEFLDNITDREFANALVFKEKPDLDHIKKLFPVGSVIKAETN